MKDILAKLAALEAMGSVKPAPKKINEMRIDELSPNTLQNYAGKAQGEASWANGVAQHGRYNDKEQLSPDKQKYADHAAKRRAGAKKADAKAGAQSPTQQQSYDWAKKGGYGDKSNPAVREDDEQLDELSPNTLGNYAKKANHERGALAKEKMTPANGFGRKADNRGQGVMKSIDKLGGSSAVKGAAITARGDHTTGAPGASKSKAAFDKKIDSRISSKNRSVKENSYVKGCDVILESAHFRVNDPQLARVLRRFPHEVTQFMVNDELDDDLYGALFDHYMDAGEIPYGIAKGRSGDPYNWISERLASDMNGKQAQAQPQGMDEATNSQDPDSDDRLIQLYMSKYNATYQEALEAIHYDNEYNAVEDLEEMSPAQNTRAGAFRDPAVEKRKNDAWTRAKQSVASGGRAHSFATPADTNPAFGSHGDRAGQARAGAGSWSGNFESIDEAVLLENTPEAIAEALAAVGLDEGLDFFFENEELHVIGSHEAKVAYNALVGCDQISGEPKVSNISGEEFLITIEDESDHDYENSLDDEQYESVDPELDEAMTDVQKWRMAQKQGDTYQTGEQQMDLDREYTLAKDPAQRATIKAKMAQLARKRSETKSMSYESVNEDAQLSLSADGEDDVLNLIRKLSGLPEKSPEISVEPELGMDDEMEMGDDMGIDRAIDDVEVIDLGMGDDMGGEEDFVNDDSMAMGVSDEMEADPEFADDEVDLSMGDEMDESEYANEPQPSVHTSTSAMINQGNDLNRPKRMSYPMRNLGNNPMSETRNLMRQYDSALKEFKQ